MKKKDLLGLYVTGHPLDEYLKIEKLSKPIAIIKEEGKQNDVICTGIITDIRDVYTKMVTIWQSLK